MKAPTLFLKALSWLAWMSMGMGLFSIFCAGLSTILPRYRIDTTLEVDAPIYMLGVDHRVNFFLIASCFFLLTIALFTFIGQHKKE
jgi:hypothetical protein